MESQNCHRTQDARKACSNSQRAKSVYDDGNIPDIDDCESRPVEPLPESTRPRKDGPGGD